MFIETLFTVAKTWKQPKYPQTDEWIKKMGTYIQWNTTEASAVIWKQLEIILLSKVSQKEKDKYHMILLM